MTMSRMFAATAVAVGLTFAAVAQDRGPIKVAVIQDKTGPLEAYAKQAIVGIQMGIEFATQGSNQVLGRKIELIEKDSQAKPDVGKSLLAQAFGDDNAHIAIGPTGSGVAVAMLPVAEEYKKILLVEPAVAEAITGANWNRYIFRTARNSWHDGFANAIAVGKKGGSAAILAQDYVFGKEGALALKEGFKKTDTTVVHEEFAPFATTDFTAHVQRVVDALKDKPGEKLVFVIWAGPVNALSKTKDLIPAASGIKVVTGGNILPAMAAYKDFPGMEGATYYYYELPKNPINDWLVAEHKKRFGGAPPDFFTAGGMAAGLAVVEGLKKAGSTDTEKLIAAMEGMEFQTPKGRMVFRKDDHQAMQSMYHFKVKVDPAVAWAIPELVREIPISELDIPIRNKR